MTATTTLPRPALTGKPATALRLLRRILSRIVAGAILLWAVLTLVFFTLHGIPGNIARMLAGAEEFTPEIEAAITREWGLDQPILNQYLDFVGRLLVGDFGMSYVQRRPVFDVVGEQLPHTVSLALAAGILGVGVSIVLALLVANSTSTLRSFTSGIQLVLASVPTFWIGLLLLLGFSFTLRLFPVAGAEGWQSLVLPAITLSLPVVGLLGQVLRESFERTLSEPFIVTVRSRGVSESRLTLVHTLRHALVPAITIAGSVIGGLLGGTVITETVFGRPGLGSVTFRAVVQKDIPVVLVVVLLAAALYIVISTLLDIIYVFVDPRLKAN